MTTLKFCTPEMLDNIRKEVPLMADYQPAEGEVPTNAQLYRIYIERYLCSLPVVNQGMDSSRYISSLATRYGKSTSAFSPTSSTTCW